jgi:uncharacterized protein (TIGR02001 family)
VLVNVQTVKEKYMKHIMNKTVVAGMITAVAGMASAQNEVVTEEVVVAEVPATEVSVTADFASAYVFRGVTINDGAVFQPGIEATGLGLKEEYGSVTVGVWGNFDFDNYKDSDSSEFSEVDWYASYSLPTLIDGLDLFIGWIEYTYPGSDGGADKEGNIGAGYDIAGVALGATAYFGAGGAVHNSQYYDFTVGYDLELSEELGLSLGASAAYSDPDTGKDGWADGTLSIGLGYALSDNWSIGASAMYIGQLDDDVLVDEERGSYGYDVEGVGMLSIAGNF